jgi:hypothetical protein
MSALKFFIQLLLWPFQFISVNLYGLWLRRRRRGAVYAIRISSGARFVVTKDFTEIALVHWKAPFTDGFQCVLPQGTILVAFSDSPPGIAAVSCVPESASLFISEHVPEEIRGNSKFAGISFVLDKSLIGNTIAVA